MMNMRCMIVAVRIKSEERCVVLFFSKLRRENGNQQTEDE